MHPTGCIDVYSEGTAIDEGDARVHQRQQRRRELCRPVDRGGELLGGLQDRRAVRIDLGDVEEAAEGLALLGEDLLQDGIAAVVFDLSHTCLLYTSDAADERSSVDLGGRRIIK